MINQINATDLHQLLTQNDDLQLIDVRQPDEYNDFHIDGTLMPLGQLPEFLPQIVADKPVVVYCRSGVRSMRAAEYLEQNGVKEILNLTGGILAWIQIYGRTSWRSPQ
jgi:sulfur-carrier protein adenylyltransferase/sulfurtransferase